MQLWPHATFITSAPDMAFLPPDLGKEVVFIGRSNVGKSSLINALTHKHCARTSKTPGRTQAFNCFAIGEATRMIDVPGMGFATSSVQQRRKWSDMLTDYMVHRQSLVGIILICDLRHPLQKWDEIMLRWCENSQQPVHIVLNKADKLNQQAKRKMMAYYADALKDVASMQWLSVKDKKNFAPLHACLKSWL